MKSLNQAVFEAAYDWILASGGKPHIQVAGEGLIKSPALRTKLISDPRLPGVDIVILNVSPHAGVYNYTDGLFIIQCRVNGVECKEFIPWENITVVFDMLNQTHAVPGFPVLMTQNQEPEAKPVKGRPKFGVIDGGLK